MFALIVSYQQVLAPDHDLIVYRHQAPIVTIRHLERKNLGRANFKDRIGIAHLEIQDSAVAAADLAAPVMHER